MRKLFLSLLMLTLLCCTHALADSFTFADMGAECKIDAGKYTVLTRDNLASRSDWLAANNKTVDTVLADFQARGVFLQAWSTTGDVCIEITAIQDDFAATYFDVNEVTDDDRKTYRTGHTTDKSGYWRAMGYDYTSATWQKYSDIGRFLKVEYTRTVGGETYRGYARKTIRNGWHIQVDYQVRGRSLKSSDNSALEAVMKTWAFLEVLPRPANADTANILFTETPPQETNTGKFTVAGSGSPGLKITAVVMRMNSGGSATNFTVTIDKKGKFSISVVLPQEGYWLMTYIVEAGDETIEEGTFDGITYDKNMIPVNLNAAFPATMVLTGNSLVISGTTLPQTTVQCYVDGRGDPKQIKTNNSGGFSFTIDTSAEGLYRISLTFQKKNYNARRFQCEASRTYTEGDMQEKIRSEAVKPSYSTLTSKLNSYRGRYLVYTVHVQSVEKTATGYLIFGGLTLTKSGVYRDRLIIRSTEEPDLTAGKSAKMYLKCIGSYDYTVDGKTESFPYFDLEFVD